MTELATRPEASIGAFNPNDEKVLQYLGFSPNDPKARAVVAVARRYDLDPLLKHVIVIPSGGVYITRDGFLHVAHTSGLLDGIVVEQEPMLSEDGSEWVARVSVYRKDMRFPFTYPGRYPARGGSNVKYAPEMAMKAAEAHALRRAFNVTGLPGEDEQRPGADEQPAQQRVTAADIRARQAAPAPMPPQPERDEEVPPLSITSGQLTKLHTVFSAIGWTDRDDRIRAAAAIVGRPLESSKELTLDEARDLIDQLEPITTQADPAGALTDLLAELREQGIQDAEIVEDES